MPRPQPSASNRLHLRVADDISAKGKGHFIEETDQERPTLDVFLVVRAGQHAGTEAPIRQGIYMIGRDGECQIRPKSQSVSQRHCLVQHTPGVVRVLDLDSEQGTFLNNKRLPAKTWHLLNHGDRLRCGRYEFLVTIYAQEEAPQDDEAMTIRRIDSPAVNGSKINGVAATESSLNNESTDSAAKPLEDFEIDFDDFDNLEAAGGSFSVNPAPTAHSPVADKPATMGSHGRTTAESTTASGSDTQPALVAKAPKASAIRLPKASIPRTRSSRSYSFSLSGFGADQWKIWVAGVVTIATLGYVGHWVYQVQISPPVKILRGID